MTLFSGSKESIKSPLKHNPLRNPGESLERYIDHYLNDKIFAYLLIALFVCLIAFLEWVRYFTQAQPNPLLFTFLAVATLAAVAARVTPRFRKLRNLRQGLKGEKYVGQAIERLREDGAKVFHDIPGHGFNIDHVVIHKSAIYVIETKTYSKPAGGDSKIYYDGKNLTIPGKGVQNKQIRQALASATWVRNLLKDSTGISFTTRPVLIFPNWYIESTHPSSQRSLWVLNSDSLREFIANQPARIPADKVEMAAFHLSQYVRSFKS